MKYDDASWHSGGDYPKDLPPENAATHIGMFLAWCLCNGFASNELNEEYKDDIQKVVSGDMTGGQFLIENCDGKFTDTDLSEAGQLFAVDYYDGNTNFAKKFSSYTTDYCDVLDTKAKKCGFEYPSAYHYEDTKENYSLIASKVNKRFLQWKKYHKFGK